MIQNLAKILKIIKTDNWEMYFENPTMDYFNIEKNEIKAIISNKKGSFIRHVPDYYGPKGTIGYALIRGYNCQGKCYYCYLQTYFKNPDIVKFTNTKNYINFLKKFLDQATKKFKNKTIIFYDGDFQDSFGFINLKENINQLDEILNLFSQYNTVKLEIRTKQALYNPEYLKIIRKIYSNKFQNTLITAITFSPTRIINDYEPGTSDLKNRLNFAKRVQSQGFQIGIRLDPLIMDQDFDYFKEEYGNLIDQIRNTLNKNLIYNRGIGILRIKKNLYSFLKQNGSAIINNLIHQGNFYKYPDKTKENIFNFILNKIGKNSYICMEKY